MYITRYKSLKIGMDDVCSSLWWRRLHDWTDVSDADFQTVISLYLQNISTYLFCAAERMLSTIIVPYFRFSYQNRRGLNWPILRPLWLMTSAADVINVPSVMQAGWVYIQGVGVGVLAYKHYKLIKFLGPDLLQLLRDALKDLVSMVGHYKLCNEQCASAWLSAWGGMMFEGI